jgi:hypothetical protein
MINQTIFPMANLKPGKYPHQVAVNLDPDNFQYFSNLAKKDQRRLGEYIRIMLDRLRLAELEKEKP